MSKTRERALSSLVRFRPSDVRHNPAFKSYHASYKSRAILPPRRAVPPPVYKPSKRSSPLGKTGWHGLAKMMKRHSTFYP